MERPLDYVLRTVEERGVRFVRLWFTDVLGKLKSFAITPAELEGALEEGMTFDGSTIQGYTRIHKRTGARLDVVQDRIRMSGAEKARVVEAIDCGATEVCLQGGIHPDFDGDGQIGEDGEDERDQPHADVHFRELQQLRDFRPFAHVVRDDEQNRREGRERDESSERRRHQQHRQ